MKSVTPTPAPRSMSPAIRNEIDELKKHAVDSETSKAHFFCKFDFSLLTNFPHYHLQVQANPKKLYKKTDAIFSIYGRNRINP